MPETTTIPEVLTLEDAGRFLKLSPDAVVRQAEAGQLPGRQVESSWRFLLSALEDWLGRRDSKAIFLEEAGAFKDANPVSRKARVGIYYYHFQTPDYFAQNLIAKRSMSRHLNTMAVQELPASSETAAAVRPPPTDLRRPDMKMTNTLKRQASLLILATLPILAGCVGIAERMATHLAEKSLHHQHDFTLIEGDLALYRSCLHQRGGTCQGDAGTALPATGAAKAPATPTRAAVGSHLATSVAALPSGDSAKLAKAALDHPVLADTVSLHNHLRGLDGASSAGFSVATTKDDTGTQSTAQMKMSISQLKSFQALVHRTTAAGGWHALASHAAGETAKSSPGSAGHEELIADHRRAVFLKKYVEAYFRNGRFLAVDLRIEATQAQAAIKRELSQHASSTCQAYNAQSSTTSPATAPSVASADCQALAATIYETLRGSSSSIDHQLVKISPAGFVSRSGTKAQFPGLDIDIDPLSQHLLTLTPESGETINFTQIGTQLVKIVLEAVFDAHEGLPAVSTATARTLGAESLPLLNPPLGNISKADLSAMNNVNNRVEAATGVVLDRVVAGIGPLSLNNEPLEQLIVTLITTSVVKAVDKATWCWYACNLDVDLKKAEKDVGEKMKAFEEREKKRVRLALRIGS